MVIGQNSRKAKQQVTLGRPIYPDDGCRRNMTFHRKMIGDCYSVVYVSFRLSISVSAFFELA